jgi:hypothetical protein
MLVHGRSTNTFTTGWSLVRQPKSIPDASLSPGPDQDGIPLMVQSSIISVKNGVSDLISTPNF